MVKMVVVIMETKDRTLGFPKGGRKDNHGDNFYGTDDGRFSFGTSRYSQQVGDGSKYRPDELLPFHQGCSVRHQETQLST